MGSWPERVVWWQIYPLGFVGAEADAIDGLVHRLGHLWTWFDYVTELGCNGIALGPVFASQTHGYDTIDHYRVDSRLGDDHDLDELISRARDRGIRLLLDGVFNHVGRNHPRFLEACARGPDSEAGDWFKWTESGPSVFEGHSRLVTLNHDNPAVASHVVDVMRHWLGRGVDGWRLDAAYAVPSRFWADVVPRVREQYPDVWLVGEVIHGDYAAFVTGTGLDSVTQYELWKSLWSALNDANFFELAHALERHNAMLRVFVPATFVGNHDVTRLASRLTDERHIPIAVAILLFVAGVPSIYHGDEQRFRGVKEARAGGDDAVRPRFPDSPRDLAPYGWSTYRTHQALIGVRRDHPWLHHAATAVSDLANTTITLTASDPPSRTSLVLTANISEHPVSAPRGAPLAGGDGLHTAIPSNGWAIHRVSSVG